MEIITTTLGKAHIRRIGDDFMLIMKFDHGRLRKPYLPLEWTWILTPREGAPKIFKTMQLTDAKEWCQVSNTQIRLKCTFSELHAVGHAIHDIWMDA